MCSICHVFAKHSEAKNLKRITKKQIYKFEILRYAQNDTIKAQLVKNERKKMKFFKFILAVFLSFFVHRFFSEVLYNCYVRFFLFSGETLMKPIRNSPEVLKMHLQRCHIQDIFSSDIALPRRDSRNFSFVFCLF